MQAPARTVSERLQRTCYSVEDMRKLAARRLPKSIFEYIEGGGEDEVSLRRNRSSFDEWSFLPKWGSVDNLDLTSNLFGSPVSMPVTLSPPVGPGCSTPRVSPPWPVLRLPQAFPMDWPI